MEQTEGTFLVTHADDESVVLQDVETGQVLTLADNPALDEGGALTEGEVLVATVAPEPPLEVAYQIATLEARREVTLTESPEPPTQHAVDLAAEQAVGEVTTRERAGEGEVHVLTVPEDGTESAVADVLADEETIARAARLGVGRVEVRSQAGVVSVRYLP